MSAPGRGGGYIARNKKPPRDGKEAPFLTGKVSITCPVSGVTTDYWLDGFPRSKDGSTFYAVKLKAMKPRGERQQQRQSHAAPGGSGGARPGGMAARPGGSSPPRPGGGAARPGSGAPPRPGGAR